MIRALCLPNPPADLVRLAVACFDALTLTCPAPAAEVLLARYRPPPPPPPSAGDGEGAGDGREAAAGTAAEGEADRGAGVAGAVKAEPGKVRPGYEECGMRVGWVRYKRRMGGGGGPDCLGGWRASVLEVNVVQ